MRIVALSCVFVVVTITSAGLYACGPEDAFGNASKFGGGSRFAGSRGGGFPAFAQYPTFRNNSAALAAAQVNQHRQMLAMQAAARRERRRPMKLAKAIALREYKLAERASRRAWVLAKQEERHRKEAEEATQDPTPTAPNQGEVMVASYTSRFSR